MTDQVVIGIDPSLNSLGICLPDGEGSPITCRIRSQGHKGLARLDHIRRELVEIYEKVLSEHGKVSLIAYEDYSFNSKGRSTFSSGELGGLLKWTLWRECIPLLMVPPTSVKLFATGKGNAEKGQVIERVADLWGYEAPNDDEADAYVLYRMGQAYLSSRKQRCDHRRRGLEGCSIVK